MIPCLQTDKVTPKKFSREKKKKKLWENVSNIQMTCIHDCIKNSYTGQEDKNDQYCIDKRLQKRNQNKRYMDGKQAYEKLFSMISQLKL